MGNYKKNRQETIPMSARYLLLLGCLLLFASSAIPVDAVSIGVNRAELGFYNVLRGHPIDRGFQPIHTERKLAAGMSPWHALTQAKHDARWDIRDNSAWGNETPDRKAKRELEYKERIDALSKKYGTTFTPELIAKMKEVLA